ncbi:hypothetical protein SY83_09890 [Paenibacillus swuensis]|uniref:Cupin type-2 domain-containing protein n=1 Tax=Paenibacillus swuensis TaxID=1178515 RepID=A0A172THP6_9BACL|nr:hypothetical protein SY83_09890 [Paenibacillus swuensis]
MAYAGEELIDPIRRQRIVFRKTAKDTNGDLVEVEAFYQPSSVAPPAHLHPQQEERFKVLSGSITVRLNAQENIYCAGETFFIPIGVAHEMWNGSEDETRLLWQTRPAMHTDDFLEVMWGLAQEGKTNKAGVPHILQLAVIMQKYRQEFRLTKPPLIVQKIVFALLAPLGRLCGYGATRTLKGK